MCETIIIMDDDGLDIETIEADFIDLRHGFVYVEGFTFSVEKFLEVYGPTASSVRGHDCAPLPASFHVDPILTAEVAEGLVKYDRYADSEYDGREALD